MNKGDTVWWISPDNEIHECIITYKGEWYKGTFYSIQRKDNPELIEFFISLYQDIYDLLLRRLIPSLPPKNFKRCIHDSYRLGEGIYASYKEAQIVCVYASVKDTMDEL